MVVDVGKVAVAFVFDGFWVEDLGEVYSPARAAAADGDGGGVSDEFLLDSRHSLLGAS